VHAQEIRMRDEVVDVHAGERAERFARVEIALGHVAREAEQLLAALLEQGGVQLGLAGKDGVDGAHRQPGAVGDLEHLGRLEATPGEALLRRIENVVAVHAGACLPGLVAGLLPWHWRMIPFVNVVDKSYFRMVVRSNEPGLDPLPKETLMEFGIFSQMHCPPWDHQHSRFMPEREISE